MSAARQRLLDSAGELFGRHGYARVGINEIIAKAGIAKATFYQHFPSKELLCAGWLEEQALLAAERDRLLLDDPRPVRDRLEVRFDELRAGLKAGDFRGCPFCVTAVMSDPETSLREAVARHREAARTFWRALAAQHEPSAKTARDLGDAWFLLVSGAMAEAHNARAAWPVKKARRAAIALGGWE